jgi:DNA mismatch repair protein MutS
VARLAGIPKAVIERAQVILDGLEEQATERDQSFIGEANALRAAARDVQLTLFDDPDRDRLCIDLAAVDVAKLKPEEALAALTELCSRAQRWKG